MSPVRSPLDMFGELVNRVDAFFTRVHAKHHERMQCGKGCSDCCSDRLSVTLLEAASLATAISAMPEAQQKALATHAGRDDTTCAALARDGSCMVYAARPIICRTHGVAIRYGRSFDDDEQQGDAVRLPVVTACFKNFGGGDELDQLPTDDVLNQTTLSATLGGLDAAFADECGVPRGTRIDLAELAMHPGDFFDMD